MQDVPLKNQFVVKNFEKDHNRIMKKNRFKNIEYSGGPYIPIDINDDTKQKSGNAFETGSRHPKWRGGMDNETKRNRAKTYSIFGIGFFPAANSSVGATKHAQANKVKIDKSPLYISAPKLTLLDEIRIMKKRSKLNRRRNAQKRQRLLNIKLRQERVLLRKYKKSSNGGNFIRGLDALARHDKDE